MSRKMSPGFTRKNRELILTSSTLERRMQRTNQRSQNNIIALMVLHNPELPLLENAIRVICKQVAALLIIDNASSNRSDIEQLADLEPNILFQFNEENKGLAGALNDGVDTILSNMKPKWILAVDQDTILSNNYIEVICEVSDYLEAVGFKLGVLRGSHKGNIDASSLKIREVRDTLMSGCMINSDILRNAKFRVEFFVDMVDYDFCWTVRHLGYSIVLIERRMMEHKVGSYIHSFEGSLTYEKAERLEGIAKNSTILVREGKMNVLTYFLWCVIWTAALSLQGHPLLAARSLLIGIGRGLQPPIKVRDSVATRRDAK